MKDEIKEILKEIESYENKEICLVILSQEQNKALLDYLSQCPQSLNDEIRIFYKIEEEKKIPEKLNIEDDGNTITLFGEKENEWTILDNVDVIICNKINSIIDYLKSKGDE